MLVKSSFAAIAVLFSVALFSTSTAHAETKSDTKKAEKTPVIVTVQPGDTLSAIAEAHDTTYVRLFNANDFIVNPNIIDVDQQIRIPEADEHLPERMSEQPVAPVYAAAAQTATPAAASRSAAPKATYSASPGNTYYRGYCTWYAKERRPDLPNQLGNGGQWVAAASARGYATGTTPRAGAIAEMPGHVAYVESVNGDGTIVISEMNGPAGFGVVGTRTVTASQFRYIY